MLDRIRFTMIKRWHLFEMYVTWPEENATIQDMKESIRESLDSAEYWPTISSAIYLVLPPVEEECLVYEFYSILNDTNDFVLNKVKPGRRGIWSRANFHGTPLKVSAAAVSRNLQAKCNTSLA
jgi:hypothetical protein